MKLLNYSQLIYKSMLHLRKPKRVICAFVSKTSSKKIMFVLNPKYEAVLLGISIALMIYIDHFMMNTPTNELSARGIMGHWHGYIGAYEAVIFGFPVISIPIVLRFTNRLAKSGLENKWALVVIRYGLLAYFLKPTLMILVIIIMASIGLGISV